MWLRLALVAVSFGVAVHAGPRVDGTRRQRGVDDGLEQAPDPRTVRAIASGFEEPLAHVLWMRAVLEFGTRYGGTVAPEFSSWLATCVEAINVLDPKWRAPYSYMVGSFRALGDIDASDVVLERARVAFPDDYWFPFSQGMGAYLYRDDPEAAARFLSEAADLPGAPEWYRAAAGAMHEKKGRREAAIRYLEEQLEETLSPQQRASVLRKLAAVRHDALVDQWDEACRAAYAQRGLPLASPGALASLGFSLPENPRGDAWVVGRDGVVRSEGAELERRRAARASERRLVSKPMPGSGESTAPTPDPPTSPAPAPAPPAP
jgi:hypothetical protein